MKLYKFRPLGNCDDLERIEEIVEKGFYCCDFLKFNDMNEGVFSINQENVNITLDQKEQHKICSFSEKNALNSQLMWGYYANAGMGVVIEVEVDNCQNIKRVAYDEDNNLNSMEKILTNKSKEWEYENEFRYIIKDINTCGITRKIGKITKIYFGMPYANLENYYDIKEKHKKLKKYLRLKKKFKKYLKGEEVLKEFCKGKSIPCEDYSFSNKKRVVSIK